MRHMKPILLIAVLAFLAVLAGCADNSTSVPVPAKRNLSKTRPVVAPAPKSSVRSSASSLEVGQIPLPRNPQTRKFLKWAHARYAWFCSVDLNEEEDITRVSVHICYPVSDDELKVISGLKKVESLAFHAPTITDEGLRHLEDLPALNKLWMFEASKLTDEGLERLKRGKPNLDIDLPYR